MGIRTNVRVISDNLHSYCLAFPSNFTADPAKPDHAEGLPRQLHAPKFALLPLAAFECLAGLRNISGQREKHSDGVLRRSRGGTAGRVHYKDAAFSGRVDVHVIYANTRTADDLELRCFLNHFAVDRCCASHHKPIYPRNDLEKFLARDLV